jgi:diguanylate cyclase (GGDEF)-like protein/PAS domain S-box-containing protein
MSPAAQVAEALVGLAVVTAVAAGILLRRPPHRAAWLLLGAGLLAFAAGDLLALAVPARDHAGPLDIVYLAGYPLLVAGLALMHRKGERARDRAGLVDAAILALTAAVGYWVLLVGPGFGAQTGADQAAAVAYLVLDVALLGVAVRLVVAGPTRAVPSLLALGVVAVLGTDCVYQAGSLGERAALSLPLHLGWLLGMALVAAAATHPDARQAVAVPESRREALSPVRLALLASVVLIPPALIGLQAARGRYGDIAILSIALGAVLALVVTRVGLLMRDVGRTAARERTLRTAAADFVAGGDRSRIHAAALRAVDLLAPGLVASRIVDVAADEEVEVVAGGGRHDARVRGRALASSLLPYVGAGTAFRDVLVEELDIDVRDGLGLREAQGQLRVFPVRVHRELLAVVVLVTNTPLEAGTTYAVETLVAQLALALESATLADDLHVRQSEARFRALVQNSSDAILLVNRDASVTYQSPSADRMFGYPDDALVGHSVEDLCHPDDLLRVQSGLTDVLSSPGATRRLELRLRRRGGGWLDAEAVVNNLQSDPNVRASVVTVRDVSERKQFETQLTHQAFHDELTGLANRALFTDRVAHALARRERDGTTLAVLLLDLDDFKTVNDGLGHAAGDSMLRAVAERLAALVRPGDTTARLGGDEFAMVLVDLPSEPAAVHAVERIITVLGQPLVIEGKEVFVQASIGLAFAGDPADTAATPEQLLRNADAAMYVVKTDGKGRYAIFQPHMHAAALHRLDLRADLQRALDHGEFALHYQPIVSMESGGLVGVEALVRWQHPQRGLVPPDAFIPLAEETGLVVPLGLWVMEQACRQVAGWSTGSDGLSVSINVSQRQLRRAEFGAEVGDVLARTSIDPSRIALEITESAIMAEVEPTIARLRALKDLGVRVAVDDFGTGYSSFSWLRQLPVDVLKIDKEFVDELGRRDQGGFLVAAIIDLAHNLGLRTVAEGIERPTQLARLRDMHCDLGQGFHVGKPMPPEDVVDLLAMEKGKHRVDRSSGSAWAS